MSATAQRLPHPPVRPPRRPGGSPLGRVIARAGSRRSDDRSEPCELCADPVPDEHQHLLDQQNGQVLCSCRACALLFEPDRAGSGPARYRLVPTGRVRIDLGPGHGPSAELSPRALGVPVGLAFFVSQPDGAVVAHYPSPMGTTHATVDKGAWAALVTRCPVLRQMRDQVQALLVNTVRGANEHWLVPIDDCYRLVAVIRGEWRGLSGGTQVWREVDRFFTGLAPGSAPASGDPRRKDT